MLVYTVLITDNESPNIYNSQNLPVIFAAVVSFQTDDLRHFMFSHIFFLSLKNSSWLGSFISTIIGNIKLLIGNIHIRYEDGERYFNSI